MNPLPPRGLGNFIWLGLIFLTMVSSQCYNQVKDVCSETPSRENVVRVEIDKWGKHQDGLLRENSFTLHVCREHFGRDTEAGNEIDKAATLINNLPGCALSMEISRTSHKDLDELFASNPDHNYLDYVDIVAEEPSRGCLKKKDPICSDVKDEKGNIKEDGFTLNCCQHRAILGWGGTGSTDFFTISVNQICYPEGTFPLVSGILHELGHAFGMIHTPEWPEADQEYLSVMQGDLFNLSAYDAAYLRESYPRNTEPYVNLVASDLIPFNQNGTWKKRTFAGKNPAGLYIDTDGYLKDCETREHPVFYTAWFNSGNQGGDNAICMVNTLRIRSENGGQSHILKQWKAATLPAESQDSWSGQVQISAADLEANGITTGAFWLEFEVNGWGSQLEKFTDDNKVSTKLKIGELKGGCRGI
ncbi:MAG: hypothetical protein H6581_25660 [Bacteroidia bacterium]|nr:hypothetical protein [Bacteroidia bacterium]